MRGWVRATAVVAWMVLPAACGPASGEPVLEHDCRAAIPSEVTTCGNGRRDPGELCFELRDSIVIEGETVRDGEFLVGDAYGVGGMDIVVGPWLLDGLGDGTFRSAAGYGRNGDPEHAHSGGIAITDLTGEGVPDLIYAQWQLLHEAEGDPGSDCLFDCEEWGTVCIRSDAEKPRWPACPLRLDRVIYEFFVIEMGRGDGPSLIILAEDRSDNSVSRTETHHRVGDERFLVRGAGAWDDEQVEQVADVDGNGLLDVVTEELFHMQDGGHAFSPVQRPVALPPDAAFGTDVDCDGQADAVDLAGTSGTWLGLGGGLFGEVIGYFDARPTREAILVDLNNDGEPDIVRARPDEVDVRLGLGTGEFEDARTVLSRSWTRVAAGDLDNDGLMDLVGINQNRVDVVIASR